MTLLPYSKPFLTFDEQLDQLEGRGLAIPDRKAARRFLTHVNYFRLQAYWYRFEAQPHPTHTFRPGITFDHIRALYLYDRRLRSLLFGAIDAIEICFRTQLAYCLARPNRDPFAHLDPECYRTDGWHQKHCRQVWDSLRSSARRRAEAHDPRILHFQRRYQRFPDLPVWAVVEVASFTDLSKLYSALKPDIEAQVAAFLGVAGTGVLGAWLHHLSIVRNHCAHHNRLWDYRMPIAVRFPPGWQNTPDPQTLFASLLCIYTLIRSWDPHLANSWRDEVVDLVQGYLSGCPLASEFEPLMGLSANWQRHPVWQSPS